MKKGKRKMSRRKKRQKQERRETLNGLQRASKSINKIIGNVNNDLQKSIAKTNRNIGW